MQYWLVKSEPEAYSWERFVREGKAIWDGVRNYQARNNLQQMRTGDMVLFYHSVSHKQVVGVARITREHYPDPTTDDPRWVVVEMVPLQALDQAVTLAQIKDDPRLENVALIRQSRLSVMPLMAAEFDAILELGSHKPLETEM